jgi:ferredoxin
MVRTVAYLNARRKSLLGELRVARVNIKHVCNVTRCFACRFALSQHEQTVTSNALRWVKTFLHSPLHLKTTHKHGSFRYTTA